MKSIGLGLALVLSFMLFAHTPATAQGTERFMQLEQHLMQGWDRKSPAQQADAYRQLERAAVENMQRAQTNDDKMVWRNKAMFYQQQATAIEMGNAAPDTRQPPKKQHNVPNQQSMPKQQHMPNQEIIPQQQNRIREQQAPTCPPGMVVFGDGCLESRLLCRDDRGNVGRLVNGRCVGGYR